MSTLENIQSQSKQNGAEIARLIPKLRSITNKSENLSSSLSAISQTTANNGEALNSLSSLASDIKTAQTMHETKINQIISQEDSINTLANDIIITQMMHSTKLDIVSNQLTSLSSSTSTAPCDHASDFATINSRISTLSNKINALSFQLMNEGNESVYSDSDSYSSQYLHSDSYKKSPKIIFRSNIGAITLNLSLIVETTYSSNKTIKIYFDDTVIYTQTAEITPDNPLPISISQSIVCSRVAHSIYFQSTDDLAFKMYDDVFYKHINITVEGVNVLFVSDEREFMVSNSLNRIAYALLTKFESFKCGQSQLDQNFDFLTNLRTIKFGIPVQRNTGCYFIHHKKNSSNSIVNNTYPSCFLGGISSGKKYIFRGVVSDYTTEVIPSTSQYTDLDFVSPGVNNQNSDYGFSFCFKSGDKSLYSSTATGSSVKRVTFDFDIADVFYVNRLDNNTVTDFMLVIVISSIGEAYAVIYNDGVSFTSTPYQILLLGDGIHPSAYLRSNGSVDIYLNYHNKKIKKLILERNVETNLFEITSTSVVKENARRIFIANSETGAYFLKTDTEWQAYTSADATEPVSTFDYHI